MLDTPQTSLVQLFKTTRAVRAYVAPYLRQDNSYILLMCVLLLGITAANTAMIWFLGSAVNHLTGGAFELLTRTLGWLAAIVVINQIMQFIYLYTFQWVYLRFVARIRKAMLLHIMQFSYPIAERFQKGDMMARITSDIDRLLTFVLDAPLNLLSHLLVLVVYVAMLFWIDWQLALAALCLAPMFYLLQRYLAPRKGKAATRYYQRNGDLMAFEEQALGNLRGISSFTVERKVSGKHHSVFDIARHWLLKMRAIDIAYDRLFAVLIYLSGVIIVYLGMGQIESGRLMVGTLVSFIVYLGYLSIPVRGIALIPIQLQGDTGAAFRVREVFESRSLIQESPAAGDLVVPQGKITFDDVHFAYQPEGRPVFAGISQRIEAGECVALVGPSGSGKSTFANLLLRFYDPQQGTITVDGTDIKTVTLASLRSNIAIVWQEPFFINDTIRENLRLAKENATEQQMIDACMASFAWEYIEKLDNGLDTMIGTSGVSLSVGQFQRLAIAQAFLRDAPILLLDEASSALDSHSEQMIMEAIAKLRQNRTTLIIAHRYSSIRSADRVLYFNGDGTISAGRHEDLLEQHAGYQQAVQWQTAVNTNRRN
ncbi:MAG: ABC transporter ATP-binding protein [Gammaproteobacteria bacterium]|jgi:ABC-type multidrug transport system fused ATPase/permease subunit